MNEIVLLGAAYKEEAPMHMVTSYEPCEECTKKLNAGIALIEVSTSPKCPDQPPINKNPLLYPTGRMMVVKPAAIPRIFNAHVEEVLEKRKAFVEEPGYGKLLDMLQPHPQRPTNSPPDSSHGELSTAKNTPLR
jgi:hypothetical protein